MTEQGPSGVNTRIPNVARMYDYYLGGKDNFTADREAAEKVLAIVPEVRFSTRENRAFLGRSVRFMVNAGIRQFLDIGTGLPTLQNVHQVAQAIEPESRVAYVDNDPVVGVHGRAILARTENVTMVEGDLRRPQEILDQPAVRQLIDFDRPVGVMLLAIMHFISDKEDPMSIIQTLREAMAPGSYFVLSHVAIDARPAAAPGVEQVYSKASSPFISRTGAEISRFFEGFELEEPGVVNLPEWRPDPGSHVLYRGIGSYFLCGVGRRL
ncbi:S-adenosyl methyltransferase [Sinosporangium album]|uniref:S-adenosyl methyltransferase n=1 Tax=Sinosporangium album TaxID=504805 RepID=A0A1G7V1D7_9ACTN|nr:SAM-dependent methyltransferase [Sinosporangium album]SDG53695.1 S-adenosyl methyltransferase [Sinosporangium album]